MFDFILVSGGIVGLFLSLGLGALAVRVLLANPIDYDSNRSRNHKWSAPFLGEVLPATDGVRDYRVRAGMAVDLRTGALVEQGMLSEEAVDSVLEPSK